MSRSFDELHDSTPEELERLADAGCRLAGLMSRHQREKTAAVKPRLTVAVDLENITQQIHKGAGDDVTDRNNSGAPTFLHQKLRANAEYRVLFADHVQQAFFNDGPLTATNTNTGSHCAT